MSVRLLVFRTWSDQVFIIREAFRIFSLFPVFWNFRIMWQTLLLGHQKACLPSRHRGVMGSPGGPAWHLPAALLLGRTLRPVLSNRGNVSGTDVVVRLGEWTEVGEARNRDTPHSWLASIKQGMGQATQSRILTASLLQFQPHSLLPPLWGAWWPWADSSGWNDSWLVHSPFSWLLGLQFSLLWWVSCLSFIFPSSKNLWKFFSAALFIFMSCIIFPPLTVILVEFGWIQKCIRFLGMLCKLPLNWWLKTTEIYSLTFLEAEVWNQFHRTEITVLAGPHSSWRLQGKICS